MSEQDKQHERRQYPRYNAPICYRSAPFFSRRKTSINIGPGGIRIYSDHQFKVGKRLEIELLLPDGEILRVTTRVAWQQEQQHDEAVSYDVGLQFLNLSEEEAKQLEKALASYT